ncbi:hypothetical protein BKA80DRAFT_336209 [Phyllosticta citrichinensis]
MLQSFQYGHPSSGQPTHPSNTKDFPGDYKASAYLVNPIGVDHRPSYRYEAYQIGHGDQDTTHTRESYDEAFYGNSGGSASNIGGDRVGGSALETCQIESEGDCRIPDNHSLESSATPHKPVTSVAPSPIPSFPPFTTDGHMPSEASDLSHVKLEKHDSMATTDLVESSPSHAGPMDPVTKTSGSPSMPFHQDGHVPDEPSELRQTDIGAEARTLKNGPTHSSATHDEATRATPATSGTLSSPSNADGNEPSNMPDNQSRPLSADEVKALLHRICLCVVNGHSCVIPYC